MKNLIEEIEKLKPQIITDKYSDGFQNAIKMVLNKLNQHNIITAPKQIKLSEIVSRLEETYIGFDAKIVAKKKKKHIILWCKTTFNKHFILEINMSNNNIKGLDTIVAMNEDCFMNSLKWLYTL